MVDLAARELGMDPVEFRRRNLLPRFETPVTTIAGENYDSGDYPAALERVLENADYRGLRRRQDEARAQGRLIGIGVASYVEMAGFGPSGDLFESAVVRVNPDGAVTVVTGASPHGQGHETAWTQLVAPELGVDRDWITVRHGDTALLAAGTGTFGSRSAAVGGTAAHRARRDVQDQAGRIAPPM